jgi:hypothetical protein
MKQEARQMTGYTVHTGSSVKYSTGWDNIFSGAGGRKASGVKRKTSKAPAAKRAKKKSGRGH